MTTPTATETTPAGEWAGRVDPRIERLSTASLNRIVEPDTDVLGALGDGQVLPDELLSIADVSEILDSLGPEQKRTLAREEFASIVDTGIRFESVLMAGFSMVRTSGVSIGFTAVGATWPSTRAKRRE